ncbi:hypothetical protein PsorP6_016408 [Peronosclerospora sorghi]|uniref:Uncharacterized protein n=1 Tax=Peronosclerospora sorghi TaxID=230839 RepID=A0ACC0VT46_9STRA|nr:hypothetical protein PsorP6_016408 [Peronosclerospora sorghi]
MVICGLGQWTVKQATDKNNNLLPTYREGRRKLGETGGGGLESYRKKYPWWDAMADLLARNESTPSRHPNVDILPEVADEKDDSDGSISQPPPPSKRRRVSKAANNYINQVILKMEKQRKNFELSLERIRAKKRMLREARQEAV